MRPPRPAPAHRADPGAPRRSARRDPRGGARRGLRLLGLRLAVLLSCAILALSGLGWSVVRHLNDNIQRVDAFDGITVRPEPRRGVTFLLAGVDRREGLTRRERRQLHAGGTACNCTDALMLVHVSADRSRASVVSLPRDSYVDFAPHDEPGGGHRVVRHRGKINAAYAHGGPALTVATVERATGIHVNHYLELDFRSFMRTVDALGGVEVCTMTPLKDDYSGLDLPAGTSTVDGAEALRYVRARHVGGFSDFDRMRRQQHFLAQVLAELGSSGLLANPARLTAVVDSVLDSVRADRGLTSSDLVALGTAMRTFALAGAEFVQVPVADDDYRGDPEWGSSVLWHRDRARQLFERIRADQPLTSRPTRRRAVPVPIDPRGIRVQVANGSGRAGLGGRVDAELRRTGFATSGRPADSKPHGETVITYDPHWSRSASSLATALPGARLKPVEGRGPVLLVTVGADHRGVRRVKAATAGLAENPHGAVSGEEVLCP
ncbi:LCP family protein [Streptomyces capparidis]